MENLTLNAEVLVLEGLRVSPRSSLPAFVLLLLVYVFIMASNLGLVLLIAVESSLHQPMYLLFCNMILNDVFGATIIIPHVLTDITAAAAQRHIRWVHCVLQAFCVHLYGSTSHTVLMIMAFDRYVAICEPLRYASVMSGKMVLKLSVAAWSSAFVMVAVLLGLTVRLSRCRRIIPNLFCDNASLFNLSCENRMVNNVFGLSYTVLLLGSSLGCVALTYLKIAAVCLRSRSRSLNRRALQTCASHLAVYVLLLLSAFTIVVMHRFPQLSHQRKVVAVLGEVLLPALNSLIYGLQIKEIRTRIQALFCGRQKLDLHK